MVQDVTNSPAYRAAEAYERCYVTGIFRYWTPIFLERIDPKSGEHVLDVACGTGIVARSVAPLVQPGGSVVGLDINSAMLAVACQQFSDHCEEIEWREGRAESLPFPDQSFDLVACQQGLQFFTDRLAAVSEMKRVLRSGGRAGIEVWQPGDQNPIYQAIYESLASVFHTPSRDLSTPFSFGSAAALENLLREAGFRQVKVEAVRQDVHFHEPNNFIKQTVKGAGAVIPAFAKLDREMQADLLDRVRQDVAEVLEPHIQDGILTFPMNGNIGTGVA